MNQSFEVKELRKFGKQDEFRDEPDWENQVNIACQNISNESFEFEIKYVGLYFLTESFSNKLILRKLNDNIKRIYKDEQANRKIIISQIKILLEETCPYWIIKTDIKNFYENIDRKRLLKKFQDDSMLSYYSMFLLRKLFTNAITNTTTGVLRGMNISATLSEIYLRKFDKWIRNCPGVYFYARFVDDIVVFINNEIDARFLFESLNQKLGELAEGLTINKNKTQLFNGNTLKQTTIENDTTIKEKNNFEYLGYKFTKVQNRKDIILKISIADKKIKKIKSRISLSFANYLKNGDFSLLYDRINFLTGNYSIKKRNDKDSDLRAGIFFNYSQLTDYNVLNELNQYYRKILFARNGTFGNKLNSKLSFAQKEQLKKYCFKSGFAKKVYNAFDYSRMSEIVSCW
jgi:hypothetical protein